MPRCTLILAFVPLFLVLCARAQNPPQFLTAPQFSLNDLDPVAIRAGDFNGDGNLDIVTIGNNVDVLPGIGNGSFGQPKQSSYIGYAASMAVGDFNQDGRLDIVVASLLDPIVTVLLGRGDCTFQAGVDYQTGGLTYLVAVADLNGDGKLDLAIADGRNVRILAGIGDGTFGQSKVITTGSSTFNVITSDVNGDHYADLIFVSGRAVSVMLSNGDGTFQAPQSYDVNGSGFYRIAVADLNGDSKPDLVLGTTAVNILLGNGDGTFQAAKEFPTAQPAVQVVIGDFNNDQKMDVAGVGQYETEVLLGNGDGTLQSSVEYGAGRDDASLIAGKFDRNGTDDIAVMGFSGTACLLFGNHDGTFRARRLYVTGPDTSHDGISQVVIGDVNHDNKWDVLGLKESGVPSAQFSVLEGNGDGTFQPHHDFFVAGLGVALALSDLNEDGNLDVVTVNNTSVVTVSFGDGLGGFGAGIDYATGSAAPSGMAVGDVTGDGKPDVLVTDQGNDVFVLLPNRGDGSLGSPVNFSTAYEPGPIAIADVNGDQKSDVLIGNFRTVSVLLGNGDGSFQPRVDYSEGEIALTIDIADINGDRIQDIIATTAGSTVSVLPGLGDGTFLNHVDSQIGGPFPSSAAIADFNGDGKPDIAVTEQGFGLGEFVDVLFGNGDGTFLPKTQYEAGDATLSVAAADLNGDGAPDLAVAAIWIQVLLNGSGSSVELHSSNDPSHFGQAVTFTAVIKATLRGVGKPTGKVQFEDGTTILGTVPIQSGKAALTTSSLAVGGHAIRALYLGNQHFNRNKSDVVSQKVLQ
jgi:hypothetical protein